MRIGCIGDCEKCGKCQKSQGNSTRKKKITNLPKDFIPEMRLTSTHLNKFMTTETDDRYGVAFDIGTTTVVGMVWNLHTNTLVDVETRTNYQSVYGSDVISRIHFSNQDKEHNTALLQERVIRCFNDIILTQNDIREVQLAKGAILAGMQTLMKTLDMKEDEIDSILLAGAFGNYIDKKSALTIGLFPRIPEEKIRSVGNAAGAGACMALLSKAEREMAVELSLNTEHIELSKYMDFQEFYIYAMSF